MRILVLFVLFSCLTFAATGDILAVRVVGSTTTVTDASSACNTASACTGWVLEVDVANLSTGGTYSLGFTGNRLPTAPKVTCAVTSSGYDATATLGTTTRTVYGTHPLRKAYNATYQAALPYPADETLVSTTLTLRFALSQAVFSAETMSCNIAAGLYTQGGTPTNTASGVVVTNNSTLAYWQARALINRSWPGNERMNASLTGDGWNHPDGSFSMRTIAFDQFPRNGRPVACVKYTLTGQTSAHVETVIVTVPTVDSTMTYDPTKVTEYIGTFTSTQIAGFTQGELVRLDYAAYPWIGDSTAVMDTADNVNAAPNPNYSPQYFICDRLGTFGTSATVVDPTNGNDATGQTVAESAFNGVNDNATTHPYATVRGAAIGMSTFNNTNYSRRDLAGTMYLQAGTYVWTGSSATLTADSGTNASQAWLTVTPFPGVARSSVQVTSITDTTNNKLTHTPLHIKGITVAVTTGTPTEVFQGTGTGAKYLWLDGCSLSMTVGSSIAYFFDIVHYTYNTSPTDVKSAYTAFSSTAAPGVMRGNSVDNIGHSITGCIILANTTVTATSTSWKIAPVEVTGALQCTHPIIAYNRLHGVVGTSGGFLSTGSTSTSPTVAPGVTGYSGKLIGVAIVQNDIEMNVANQLISTAADGGTNTPIQNVLYWNNTLSGGRINGCYDDVTAGTFESRILWSYLGNIWESSASKHDTFGASPAATRIGAWQCLYAVGWTGNMDAADGVYGSSGDWQPEWTGISSDYISTASNLDSQASPYNPPHNTVARSANYPEWINAAGYNGTTTGAGNGNYRLLSSSPARNLIRAGFAALPYDLDGQIRSNSGFGSAGAYAQEAINTRVFGW